MPKYAKFMKDLLTQRGRGQGGINKALADLEASISLIPHSIFLRLNLGELKPTRMCIELANKSTQIPRGAVENVIVKIDRFVFPVDFVVLDMKEDRKIPIILGRPFPPSDDDTCHSVDIIDLSILDHVQEILPSEPFDLFLFEPINHHLPTKINSLWDDNEGEQDLINKISRGLEPESESYIKPTLFVANMFEGKKPTTKLKDLPSHLEYDFLNNNQEFPVIISSLLSTQEKELLLGVLAKHKSALAWKSMGKPHTRDPKKKEESQLLLTMTTNLFQPAPLSGWRVFIDYRKLNDAIRKDHFPLHFIDHMLEQLSGNEYYCFLDGFSGYFQIPLAPDDQEKTTFTCPYRTFAYRRMPFGLCNAPATFQWCMTIIFHDMCKDFMEGFMNDFSVFGNSFDSCLNNLSKMLARCEETNLVLNWEKCYFMVKEVIVLGHKISKAGIEVDKAKVDVIAKLPYPTNIEGIQSFLGHAGFYRRFIKDFSKIARPMTQLLMKDTKFVFFSECIESFNILKNKLTTTPVIIALNWDLDFELMCDASYYAMGAVLGQREFTIEIKDKKGLKNLAADHLSRLENPKLEELDKDAIRDSFPDEHLIIINIKEAETDPWYSDYANFLVLKIIPRHLIYHLRKKFLFDVKKYIWDDPYLFKSCPDGIVRQCVFGKELHEILEHYHTGPTRGHYGANITARKVFE
ncbi:reverse transcriptase domain-containing protein [Tanacetum coccineum]